VGEAGLPQTGADASELGCRRLWQARGACSGSSFGSRVDFGNNTLLDLV
jgi:hypothetical protein